MAAERGICIVIGSLLPRYGFKEWAAFSMKLDTSTGWLSIARCPDCSVGVVAFIRFAIVASSAGR
jgi:hypothetical protein